MEKEVTQQPQNPSSGPGSPYGGGSAYNGGYDPPTGEGYPYGGNYGPPIRGGTLEMGYHQPPSGTHPYGIPYGAPAGTQHASNVTVVMQQPAAPVIKQPREWSTHICGCCDDIGICCCGWWCPCCLATDTAVKLGESSCVPCCVPGSTIAMRTKLRTQENISGSIMSDCCYDYCCPVLSLCQLAREVKYVQKQQPRVV